MPTLTWLDDDATPLPDTRHALPAGSEAPGLLAAGGRLTLERLEEAYRRGVFPWFSDGQPVLWWSTDPRMVLRVADFKLSRSLRKTLVKFLRTPGCEVRIDSAFERVIAACSGTPRQGQSGTWIVPEIVDAYVAWHRAGRTHSVETWIDGELAGGLYGVSIGRMFFGESMFSLRTDASKIALAALVCFCRAHGMPLIDCQQNTQHLASLGAREMARTDFEAHLAHAVPAPGPRLWSYDPAHWAQLGLRGEPSA
ncbi:leucyl/phenylalanyl-tRNA--protein transferase [Aquincola sp. MAHUQ-54]|uniref:Leucyl/phenylalanyl-tRNA--protein transferase n=1 Tax=Aquincola agrisoli TaxID=3119538 RepID=A0AAW9QKA8_9BURK